MPTTEEIAEEKSRELIWDYKEKREKEGRREGGRKGEGGVLRSESQASESLIQGQQRRLICNWNTTRSVLDTLKLGIFQQQVQKTQLTKV